MGETEQEAWGKCAFCRTDYLIADLFDPYDGNANEGKPENYLCSDCYINGEAT